MKTPANAPRPVGREDSCEGGAPEGDPLAKLRDLARAEPAAIVEALRAVHCRYPTQTTLVELGRSHQDHPIVALWIGDGVHVRHDRPTFFLNGSHHGDELISTDFVLDAIATLLDEDSARARRWRKEVVVVALPLVNPDGRVITLGVNQSGRKNGRDNNGDGHRSATEGVDINRNYPFLWGEKGDKASRSDPDHKWFRGPYPGSEPETRALMRLAIAEHFVASVSFHSGAVAVLAPYTINGLRDPTPEIGRIIAGDAYRAMPRHPQGPVEFKRNLYPVDGTDQDWHYHRHGTVALLVEGARKSALGPWHRKRAFAACRAVWARLLDRYLDGPSVHGRVVDRRGQPVVAEVRIAEIATHEGESWRTRCRDGRFDRYLPGPGSYTLLVQAPGVSEVRRSVTVSTGRQRVDVQIDTTAAGRGSCPRPASLAAE